MKRKTTILALMLAFVLSFGAFSSVFAASGAPTDATRKAIVDAKVQCIQVMKNEVDAEGIAKDLHDQVTAGKYKLVNTATLKSWIDKDKKMVIVDTMPEGWWSQRHIPGAICSIVGADKGPEFKILASEKKALLKAVEKQVGTKDVTKYKNKKTKKVISATAYKKLSKKNKKKYNKVTVKEVNKNVPIVVYCGFTKCQRSHQGAMFLKKQGFKNVYRYAGGISAWVDANYPIEGKDVE